MEYLLKLLFLGIYFGERRPLRLLTMAGTRAAVGRARGSSDWTRIPVQDTVFPDTQCRSVTLQNVNAPERVTGLLTRLRPRGHAETERTESEVGLWGVWSFG